MRLFSQNLEILAPCCDVIISRLGQKKFKLVYYVQLAVKTFKSGTMITLVKKLFSDERFPEF